jgi:sugar phosphate isomerase/epimerase
MTGRPVAILQMVGGKLQAGRAGDSMLCGVWHCRPIHALLFSVPMISTFDASTWLWTSPFRTVEVELLRTIAATLDAGFFGGPMFAEVGKARQRPEDERTREWDLAVTELWTVSQQAADRGLAIALEPINRFETDLVNTTADALRMIRAIDHPAAMGMVDTFHMTIEEADIGAAIPAAGDDLIHRQVSENHRGATGSGLTPWKDFRDSLREVSYGGSIIIESVTPDEFASRGLAFLQNLFL